MQSSMIASIVTLCNGVKNEVFLFAKHVQKR